MNLKELQASWVDVPEYHKELHESFCELVNADETLNRHRTWVEANIFGFGERSFHYLWLLVVNEMPKEFSFCEIGVFRGQILSLVALISKYTGKTANIVGITPLDSSGGHWESDYSEDIKHLHEVFEVTQPKIYKGLSTDHQTMAWAGMEYRHGLNLLYVDGAHDYLSAFSDLKWYSQFVLVDGFLVIDDCNNNLNFQPNGFFTGIAEVTQAKIDWLATNPPFEFVCSCVHISVYKRI